MVRTINLNTEITSTRELNIKLPIDVPVGPAEIVVMVSTAGESKGSTFGALASSEFLGMWQDRDDITDSQEFARRLRVESWTRPA